LILNHLINDKSSIIKKTRMLAYFSSFFKILSGVKVCPDLIFFVKKISILSQFSNIRDVFQGNFVVEKFFGHVFRLICGISWIPKTTRKFHVYFILIFGSTNYMLSGILNSVLFRIVLSFFFRIGNGI